MKNKKISVIGAGHVGATVAHLAALKGLGDVVLLDVIEGVPQGKALDMYESSPIERFDVDIIGTNDYKDTKDSDIVVITAGIARKPGMSRDDLIKTNTKVMKSVSEQVAKYSPNAIVIVVTNPLDAMVWVAAEVTKFKKNRIIGMAGVLDSARFRSFIARELKVSPKKVEAMVLGGHGDTMVPLPAYSKVSGKSLDKLLSKEKSVAIGQRTRNGGAEIVSLLKTGSAYYAPASSTVEMIEAILKNQKKVLPCAAWVDGQYGMDGLFIGVPAKLGKKGVEEVVEIKLSDSEKEAFKKTADHVRELVAGIKI